MPFIRNYQERLPFTSLLTAFSRVRQRCLAGAVLHFLRLRFPGSPPLNRLRGSWHLGPMVTLTRLLPKSPLASRGSVSYLQWCLYSSAAASQFDSQISSPPHPLTFSPNLSRRDPKDRNVQWVFLGCPGVGKGTYAGRLCNLLRVPHIATGDLVSDELSSGPLSEKVARLITECPWNVSYF